LEGAVDRGNASDQQAFSAASGEDPAKRAEMRDEMDRLMGAVEALPENLREAVMLYYYEDCSYEELAARLGVSTATVNARLTQARQALRRGLGAPEQTHAWAAGRRPNRGGDAPPVSAQANDLASTPPVAQ
jgi:DNA-directed RNA polymerase specialized sigma24 family protein